MSRVNRITPFLWFSDNAEQAVAFYTSVFPNSRSVRTVRYGEAGKEQHRRPVGSVMVVDFELDGQPFTALNGGPLFTFTESVSFVVHCDSQQEIDYYWDKLRDGGDPDAQQCGWLKDRFGLSWQVVPEKMLDLLAGDDAERSQRAMAAVMQMKKIDVAAIDRAADGS